VTAIGYSQMTVTLSQYVGGKFADGVALFATMMSVNAVTVVALQVPFTKWADKLRPLTVLTIGVAFYALGNVGFGLANDWATFIVAMIVFTFGEMLTFPAGNILTDRIAPDGMRGLTTEPNRSAVWGIFSGHGSEDCCSAIITARRCS